MTYIAFLFGVAFVLVLLSFLIQQKGLPANHFGAKPKRQQRFCPGQSSFRTTNWELLEANQALQDQVVQLQADLDETSKNYSQLEETHTSLQESHAALQAQCTKQEQQVQAYELLLSAQRALDQENTEEFLTAMKDLEAFGRKFRCRRQDPVSGATPWRWSPRKIPGKLTHEVNYHVGYQTDQRSPGGGKSGSGGPKK